MRIMCKNMLRSALAKPAYLLSLLFVASSIRGEDLPPVAQWMPADKPIMVELSEPMALLGPLLNTVVPYQDDAYHRSRPTLRLAPDQVLKLDSSLGLHPAMPAFRKLYQDGRLSIIQGVGYPKSSRDHEAAMEDWHTGVLRDQVRRERGRGGWEERLTPPVTRRKPISGERLWVTSNRRSACRRRGWWFRASNRWMSGSRRDLPGVMPPRHATRAHRLQLQVPPCSRAFAPPQPTPG